MYVSARNSRGAITKFSCGITNMGGKSLRYAQPNILKRGYGWGGRRVRMPEKFSGACVFPIMVREGEHSLWAGERHDFFVHC